MTLDAILLLICKEAANIDSGIRASFISFAQLQVKFAADNPDIQNLAIANLAAHMLTMSLRSGASGQISSETEGSLSRSFSGIVMDVGGYSQTSYGQEYLRYRNMFILGGVTRSW